MTTCSKIKELLMLDSHQALEPNEKSVLITHLKSCNECSREQERLGELLEKVKASYESPELSVAQVDKLVEEVQSRLTTKRQHPMLPFPLLSFRFIRVAAVCVCLIGALLGYRYWFGGPRNEVQQEERISQRDLEIIRSLDFFQDMESIGKVVNYLDENGKKAPEVREDPEALIMKPKHREIRHV